MTWHVAGPSQYLVITGFLVKDVKITKKAWVLLGQRWSTIDITPVNYSFNVPAMSAEKVPFNLPATYTIGPDAEDTDALRKYAKLVAAHEKHAPHVIKTVQGIIEGETRVLAAGMAMDDIFEGRDQFKRKVKEGVQRELQKLGLHVYNANVMQLEDVAGHEYFSYKCKKAEKEAENYARVDVAEAQYVGDTGAKQREGRAVQEIAKVEAEMEKYKAEQKGGVERRKVAVEAETRVLVNEKKEEMGKVDYELALKKANWKKETAIANIEAQKEAELRKTEMQAEVERKNAEVEVEKLRAEVVVKSTIRREVNEEEARADLFRRQREAESGLYGKKREAEAKESVAQADAFAAKQAAEAHAFTKGKEAEAMRAKAAAIAYYVRVLSWAFVQGLALLLLVVHVNSWLAATRVAVVPSTADGLSFDVAVRLPSFFINNAVFHYLLPGSTSSQLSLATPAPPYNHDDNSPGNMSLPSMDIPAPSVPPPSPAIFGVVDSMPPHMEVPPSTIPHHDHKPLE